MNDPEPNAKRFVTRAEMEHYEIHNLLSAMRMDARFQAFLELFNAALRPEKPEWLRPGITFEQLELRAEQHLEAGLLRLELKDPHLAAMLHSAFDKIKGQSEIPPPPHHQN